MLKIQGAKKIIVSEMMECRKKFSMRLGATHVLDPNVDDVPKQVHEITDGAGVDVAFDTAGVEVAVNAAIDSCHAHGSIVNIAVWNKPPAIHVNSLMYQEMQYMGNIVRRAIIRGCHSSIAIWCVCPKSPVLDYSANACF